MCMPKPPKLPDSIGQSLNTNVVPQPMETQPPIQVAPAKEIDLKQTPPPVLTNTGTEEPTLKKRRSRRQELQQASKGTSALRIERSKGIGTKTGGTGSTGLNIPK